MVNQILSAERSESNIPSPTGEPWTFPSEKQFYKAARAKGHNINPLDMYTVLNIHNAVNEQTWKEITKYENLHRSECAVSKLLYFHGRPDELSWKAWIMMKVDGRPAPFDRHDWFVDRCGTKVRYLVDFYDGFQREGQPVAIHIDARPELTFRGAVDRIWATLSGT